MANPFKHLENNPTGLIRSWVAVTPSDSTNNVGTGNVAIGLYVTGAGTITWIDVDNNTVGPVNVAAYSYINCSVAQVKTTGTSATGIFALISA